MSQAVFGQDQKEQVLDGGGWTIQCDQIQGSSWATISWQFSLQ